MNLMKEKTQRRSAERPKSPKVAVQTPQETKEKGNLRLRLKRLIQLRKGH